MALSERQLAAAFLAAGILAAGLAAQAPALPHQEDKAAFTVLSVKDGLPNASVSGIVQDSKGFIWMSTQGGLARYDGSSFKTWENVPFNENSLSANLIQTMFLDAGDILWLGTYSGLDRFDPATGAFTIYRNAADRPDSISADLVIAIARDGEGRLWAGTANGLNRLDEKTGTFVRYHNVPGDPRSLPHNTVRSLFRDSQGRLWVGTSGGGFARYDGATDDFTVFAGSPEKAWRYTGPGAAPPSSLSLQAIVEDGTGTLWLGAWGVGLAAFSPERGLERLIPLPDNRIYALNTAEPGKLRVGTWGGGMYVVDPAKGSIAAYRSSKALGALPHDVIYAFLQDASGELWVGTNGGGVARMDRSRDSYSAWVADPDDPGALPNGKILAILVDSKGALWVSVYAGGIHRWLPREGVWKHYRRNPADPGGLPDDTTVVLYEDSAGRFWAGSNSGLCLLDRDRDRFAMVRRFGGIESPDADIIYSMLEDDREKGVYWIGTYTKGLYRWDRNAGTWKHYSHDPKDGASLSDNLVYSLARDREGRLWIGTNNGLNRLDGNGFARFFYDPRDTTGLSSSAIVRLFIDSRGILWISTRGGGLNHLDPGSSRFEHLTKGDGLPGNDVLTIVEDREGDLWVVTQTGLARLDHETWALKRITLYSELENATFNSGACLGPKGELYFGSVGVVTRFDIAGYRLNAHEPPVYVTDLVAANQPKLPAPTGSLASPIHLASWENSVEFRFAALDFRDSTQNRFAWKLEGFDRDWTYSTTRRFADYTNLPGGSYTFRVKAANNDGVWNETGAAIPFTVAAPVWLSIPALALYLLLIALAGYGFATLRANRVLSGKVRELTEARAALETANAEANRLAAEAERATRAKSDFVAMVSHEIRNSLNGIIGVAEILGRGNLDAQQAGELSVIRQSGAMLLSLVNDVLDFSRAESGHIELENRAWRPREIVERLKASVATQAAAKGVSLVCETDPAVPVLLGGDPTRIQQVLSNLLSNSVKFTERGSVRLGLGYDRSGEGGGALLRITVADTGIGIGADKIATIFEPFRQEDASTNRRFGGSGLGLAIVRQFVTAMGGSVGVESEAGLGSTFTVLIPALPAPAEREQPRAERGSASGLRVLIVDDDKVNRMVASRLVSWLGGSPGEAESGEEALAALAAAHWDVVLLDESMPGLDGRETARRRRAEEEGRGLPRVHILSMTARLEGDLRQLCEKAGMDGFVAKPLTLASLGLALSRLETRAGDGTGSGPEREEGAAAPALFDLDYFKGRYPGDEAFRGDLLRSWLDSGPALMLAMDEAAAKADWASVRAAAHRLSGSVSILTTGTLVQRLRDLEEAAMDREKGKPAAADPAALVGETEPLFAEFVGELKTYLGTLPPAQKE